MRRFTALVVLAFVALVATGKLGSLKSGLEFVQLKIVERPTIAILIALLVGWALGFIVSSYRKRYVFQNRGEARLSRELAKRFMTPDYHLLNHVTLPQRDGTTQVDHVLVSRFGIFVIETKDYKGWIFASSNGRYWTQVLYRVKFKFQNPIHQNYKHVCAVRELLDFLPPNVVRSIVVFTGSAEFKTDVPDGVFTVEGFLKHLSGLASEEISQNRLQFCVGRLETARLATSKVTDVEHVQFVRRRYGKDD